MKIYTKTGDSGNSSLYNGTRLPKSDIFFSCLGDLDELNSNLGMLKAYYLAEMEKQTVKVYNAPGAGSMVYRTEKGIDSGKYYEWFSLQECITKIQCRNMDIGTVIATPPDMKNIDKWFQKIAMDTSIYTELEYNIDRLQSILPPIGNFVVPSGNVLSSQIHICRTIARRCERNFISIPDYSKIALTTNCEEFGLTESNIDKIIEQYSIIAIYLNRLSDYFFMLARFVNMTLDIQEDLYSKSKSIFQK